MKSAINKRWNLGFLLKEITYRIPEHSELSAERRAEAIGFQMSYENEVSAYADGDGDEDVLRGIGSMASVARKRMREAEYEIYAGGRNDRSALAQGFRYRLIELLIRFAVGSISGHPPNAWACSARDLAEALACASSFGWTESAERLTRLALPMIADGALWAPEEFDPRWEKRREPFARFAISLWAKFMGIELPRQPPHPYSAPVYDTLLTCWQDSDPRTLVEPLLAACDWHTHECMYSRSDRPSKNVDFINDTLMGWPVEVHMVYRLRERLNLALPEKLDHPLMQVPLGPYLPPQPIPHDERLDRIIRRACSEVPGLQEVLQGAV
ncbi:MAG: hypothetical protein QM788_05495 [Roseateles sp.]|uniref:hypothetical protein n=1 Tax=Roseateles sp. TaxID=1971397 RepID=UPI0039E997DC